MKNILFYLFIVLGVWVNAQVNVNADCVNAIALCTNPNFTFNATSGSGNVIDFTNTSAHNVSNPQTNPSSANMGCLLSGELKPQWLLLTVGNAGSLEFVFGAANSANPQAGFYDWAMWPYTPSSCSQIFNNTLPPIRCNWNGTSTGGTGIASASNIPSGGDPSNYEPPIIVNACQQFIICISNYSGVSSLVSFQSIGSASLSCNPNCNPSYAICPGGTISVVPVNFANLTSPTFSLFPGPMVNTTGTFVVSPTVTTTYTSYISGTNSSNAVQTISATLNVTVYPKPYMSPIVNNGSCANPGNSANLNVTFNPSGSPNYTVNWTPTPSSITPVNSSTAAGLIPGTNNVSILTSNGCTNTISFTVAPIPVQASFVVVNPSNDYTITCLNPNVLLTTSITNNVPLTYTWFPSCAPSSNGPSFNFNQACTGQVVGSSSTGCTQTQTFTIYQNLTTPTIVISPTVANITCNTAGSCFTLITNVSSNVSSQWYQVIGSGSVAIGPPQGTVNIFCPTSPGIYKGCATDLITGCATCKTLEVTASVGVPQFTVTSPSNFTLGCGTTSVTSMQVSNVITSPTPNTPVSYSFVPPPATVVITPTTVLGANPNQNGITVPGVWVVYVKDLTNSCLVSQSISIIQNTMAPNIDYIQPLTKLTCKDPMMVLNGVSSNPNTTISWTVPAIPSNSVNPASSTTVNIKPSVSNATSIVTSVGIFTVGAIDNNNLCTATKTVQIIQDIRLPIFTISALTNSLITCKNTDVLIVPIITPTLATALIPTYMWFPPVGNSIGGTSYNSTSAGSHTAISISTTNGCTTSATYNIGIDINPPALNPSPNFTLDCSDTPTVALMPNITGTTTSFTYSWTIPDGAVSSNLTSSVLVTNKSGLYRVLVTNVSNGCFDTEIYRVENGALTADFNPSIINGFVPLTVNFINTSATSTGASSIMCLWNFGNGIITPTAVLNNANQSTTYNSPGTYSVVLFASKGSCVDSALKIITVELPSKMEVPNVFTPNGDKVNDIFYLHTSNLQKIEAKIFDRWGNLVYNVTSETGNISWDGKNSQGKNCAEGTYFYIIKAVGKDAAEYEQNGNVSLYR